MTLCRPTSGDSSGFPRVRVSVVSPRFFLSPLRRLLEPARAIVGAERAEAQGRLDQFLSSTLTGEPCPNPRGVRTAPTPLIVEHVVKQIDTIVKPIRGNSWRESHPGDRKLRGQLRLVLKNHGLPPQGELNDRTCAYIREHYEYTSRPVQRLARAAQRELGT